MIPRADFVKDNFPFYSILLLHFMERAKTFDLYASVRPVTSRQDYSKKSVLKSKVYLDIVESILALFSNEKLGSLLKLLESSLLNLESKSMQSPGAGMSRAPSTAWEIPKVTQHVAATETLEEFSKGLCLIFFS